MIHFLMGRIRHGASDRHSRTHGSACSASHSLRNVGACSKSAIHAPVAPARSPRLPLHNSNGLSMCCHPLLHSVSVSEPGRPHTWVRRASVEDVACATGLPSYAFPEAT